MSDLYIEVDPKNKTVLGSPKPLELNWNNIGGLVFLDDTKLSDLTWAGYENSGFIKFSIDNKNTLRCYSCESKLLEDIKTQLTQELSKIRYEYECGGVIINEQYSLSTDDRSKLLMQIKYLECKENLELEFIWKTSSGFIKLSSNEFIIIWDKIRNFIQRSFDLEYKMHSVISECEDFVSLLYIDLKSIPWESNKIII
jgi:hypothetical protein